MDDSEQLDFFTLWPPLITLGSGGFDSMSFFPRFLFYAFYCYYFILLLLFFLFPKTSAQLGTLFQIKIDTT